MKSYLSRVWQLYWRVSLIHLAGKYEYLYGVSNTPVAQIEKSTGKVTYLHADSLGTVVLATKADSTPAATYVYDAYGKLNATRSTDLNRTVTRFGYAGEWADPTTGLYNLRARWYEAGTGTFLSQDPLLQSTNEAYSYGAGNPLLYTDPLGLEATEFSSYREEYGSLWNTPPIKYFIDNMTNYHYRYDWVIGDASDFTAEQAMDVFQNSPGEIFPFNVKGCDTLTTGQNCQLSALSNTDILTNLDWVNDPLRSLALHNGTVAVNSTCDSVEFTVSRPWYFDPIGSTIKFTTYESNGKIIFSQETDVSGVWFLAGAGVNFGDRAKETWRDQASNLSGKMYSR